MVNNYTWVKPSKKIFIAHGTNPKPVKELKAILEKFGLKPILLSEQPSGSRTIVEKLERNFRGVEYAFIILTPDDGSFSFEAFPNIMKQIEAQTGQSFDAFRQFFDLFIPPICYIEFIHPIMDLIHCIPTAYVFKSG